MPEYSRWKTAAILGVTLLVCLAAVPGVLPAATFDQLPKWAQRKPGLGYDLTGGERWQFEVDIADLKNLKLALLRDDVRDLLRNQKIGHTRIVIRDGGIEFAVRNVADVPRTLALLDPWTRPLVAPAPVRPLFASSVDGRPSIWAHASAQVLEPFLAMTTSEATVRLAPTDAAMSSYVVHGRDAMASRIGRFFNDLGVPHRLHVVGTDRLVVETTVSLDRLKHVHF